MPRLNVTFFSDPTCPWSYSSNPFFRVLDWRYKDQLAWRLALIGLADTRDAWIANGDTPLRVAQGHADFRRYGMPFAPQPKIRVAASGRACRAVVAARLVDPGAEWRVFRALQFANFTSSFVIDDDQQIREVLGGIDGVDADEIVARLDDLEVSRAYAADKAEARTAKCTAADLQGKTKQDDGPVRFTAPSLVFAREDGLQLTAGGFQSVAAYDVLVVNLDPSLARAPAPDTPAPLLEYFADGLTTLEVAALMVRGNDDPDVLQAENALLELVAAGNATRESLGNDALWRPASQPASRQTRGDKTDSKKVKSKTV